MKLNPRNCNKPPNFIELYQHLLNDWEPKKILEIGIQTGDSLRMWADAFPQSQVLGLDKDANLGPFPSNVQTIVGKQNDTKLLQSLGRLDFIVDDGSHMSSDQQTSFETLFPLLNDGGIYVIEDTEINRQTQFQNTQLSTTDYFINKLLTTSFNNQTVFVFQRENIKSITFGDNVIVINKI